MGALSSMLGMISDHTAAATITPEAKPSNAFCNLDGMESRMKNTNADPTTVPMKGMSNISVVMLYKKIRNLSLYVQTYIFFHAPPTPIKKFYVSLHHENESKLETYHHDNPRVPAAKASYRLIPHVARHSYSAASRR
jgi:hypothetical protein